MTMLIDSDPGAFFVIILAAAALFGPFIFGILYAIAYITSPPSITNDVELRPDTRVGCSDGLCYLHLFKRQYHTQLTKQLGHFPSVFAISVINKSYRTRARGELEIIGDGMAHFEPDYRGGLVWDIVKDAMGRFSLISGGELSTLSFSPPAGYSYLELFVPTKRNEILSMLGPNPLLQSVIDIDSVYRLSIEGYLIEEEEGFLKVVKANIGMEAWAQVIAWDDFRQEVRVGM
jgi:hypothetical protein